MSFILYFLTIKFVCSRFLFFNNFLYNKVLLLSVILELFFKESASIRFRHYIKSWIYSDLIPKNYYRDENNFKNEYSIRFNLVDNTSKDKISIVNNYLTN